jgi:hypothetical protein
MPGLPDKEAFSLYISVLCCIFAAGCVSANCHLPKRFFMSEIQEKGRKGYCFLYIVGFFIGFIILWMYVYNINFPLTFD